MHLDQGQARWSIKSPCERSHRTNLIADDSSQHSTSGAQVKSRDSGANLVDQACMNSTRPQNDRNIRHRSDPRERSRQIANLAASKSWPTTARLDHSALVACVLGTSDFAVDVVFAGWFLHHRSCRCARHLELRRSLCLGRVRLGVVIDYPRGLYNADSRPRSLPGAPCMARPEK